MDGSPGMRNVSATVSTVRRFCRTSVVPGRGFENGLKPVGDVFRGKSKKVRAKNTGRFLKSVRRHHIIAFGGGS